MEIVKIIVTLVILIALGIMTFCIIKNSGDPWSSIFVSTTDNGTCNIATTDNTTIVNKRAVNVNKDNGTNNVVNTRENGVTQVTGELGCTKRLCFDLKCPPAPDTCCPSCPTCPVCGNNPDTPKKTEDEPKVSEKDTKKSCKKNSKKNKRKKNNSNCNTNDNTNANNANSNNNANANVTANCSITPVHPNIHYNMRPHPCQRIDNGCISNCDCRYRQFYDYPVSRPCCTDSIIYY